ncbi:MAG: type IX secretion system membrane protein PorP/SprF [Flavobacteriales bacterium]|nr:type IX secretion system membrane protein PorP/SprF [Flavobacteriales bacterium]
MIKRLLFIMFLVFGMQQGLKSQQIQQFSQYFLSGYSFNPAFAGVQENFEALATHRTQWAGITDAPRTYFLGLHAPSESRKMGFGGSVFTDGAGPTRRTGLQGTYSYQLRVTEHSKLSLGVSFGLTQFSIDGTQITLRDNDDQALVNSMQAELKPDASFGVLWYSDKFYAGLSAAQLFNNELSLFEGDSEGRMALHYFLTGGYEFSINEQFDVEPSVLVKYLNPLDPQIDLSTRVIYKGNLWLGGSYRTNDAAAVFAGYEIMNYLTLGYSIDFTTSELRNYSNGTHEIFLGIRFGKEKMTEPEQ